MGCEVFAVKYQPVTKYYTDLSVVTMSFKLCLLREEYWGGVVIFKNTAIG